MYFLLLICQLIADRGENIIAVSSHPVRISQENKWMKQFLEDEQKSRKDLERVVRKLAKQKNDCGWDDGSH